MKIMKAQYYYEVTWPRIRKKREYYPANLTLNPLFFPLGKEYLPWCEIWH